MASEEDSPAVADSGPAGDPNWNSDFDGIYLDPACHIQRAESRFGSHVTEDIRHFVFEDTGGSTIQINPGEDDDEEEDEEEDDDDDEDDWDDIDLTANPLLPNHPEEAQLAESSPGNHTHGHPGFPKMARLRCNLTALSQHYNLYFAAYQDKIYVYQPKKAPEILPGPSIILHPKITKAARMFGGVIDRMFPHQINNMVVGNLGDLEVLLFVYDDGDVGAYYTHTIVRAILANDEQRQGLGTPGARPVIPRQFFCENVGQSAWGVAIHEKSRLLAVSSNRHEVTVFAFAMNGHRDCSKPADEVDGSPKVWSGQTALGLERHFRSRTRTWRIILPIGTQGNNIPTIAFLEDQENGEALKIVALDINENTWILDIWRIGSKAVMVPGAPNRGLIAPQRLIGWGVLALPDSSFRHVKSVREAVGVPGDQIIDRHVDISRSRGPTPDRRNTWLDTTCSLYYIKDLASNPATDLRNRFGATYSNAHLRGWRPPTETASALMPMDAADEPSDEEMEHTDTSEQNSEADSPKSSDEETKEDECTLSARWRVLSKGPGPFGSTLDDLDSETQVSRVIIPSFGETPRFDGSSYSFMDLVSASSSRKNKTQVAFLLSDQDITLDESLKGLSILRATATDIELVPLDASAASVQCKCVITYHNHHRRRQEPYDLTRNISERISMLIHVPELNLVVAGALNGRVALLSLTKTKATVHGRPLRRGFRVDYVLPRKSDEDKRLRPWCTLHGIAMSPVPALDTTRGLQLMDTTGRSGPPMASLRYRLILHYLDHTILMYYIEKKGDELIVS